ncbi:type I phosphomannose isomerase catalytic subunit [Anaerocolumna xylanovorans]|uniref:Phosphohexomutase n=1 Tax=Anaerocolumna xylanovorans DSM 12503 TaxID=1121345 RepID=A0A1M7YGQ2_9FIRM|nr:type I phosphomannose isomerase catalytic subunit [Anaerocolumna xylanovorans]SHO51766.1 mannose-6-phosphate isomerase, class I [Anaerocolumna xylanovorans DSM 12503]
MKRCIGIDIGGTKTNIGIVQEDGSVLARKKLPSDTCGGIVAFVETIYRETMDLLHQNRLKLDEMEDIGIGIPGTVDSFTGMVEFSPNLFGTDIKVGTVFEKKFGRKITLIQDSWAAAWGERLFGAGKLYENFFCVTLGTGIGCGIIYQGGILKGTMQSAGEIGHTTIIRGGRKCSCGNYGCLECYSSGTGILKQAMELFPEKLKGEESSERVFELADEGDKDAIDLIEDAVDKLAFGLAMMVNLLAIDTFLISGGLCVHKKRIIDPLPSLIEKYGYDSWARKKKIKVVQAELGSDAPMIGAAFINAENDRKFKNKKELIFFSPIPRDAIWGGALLKEYFHYDNYGNQVGQSWSFSGQKSASNAAVNEEYKGLTLRMLWEQRPELFNSSFSEFPFIISLVLPVDDLSIQVHPDAEYARKKGFPSGKNEAWYFIEAEEGSSIVYGHKAENEKDLRKYINEKKWDSLIEQRAVHTKDFVYIPAGTLHALKKGSIVYEVQQAADITYRFYDYDRRDKEGKARELHLEEAIACLSYQKAGEDKPPVILKEEKECRIIRYHNDESFCITQIEVHGKSDTSFAKYQLATVIRGKGTVEGKAVSIGESFLIPADYGKVILDGDMDIMLTSEKV